MVLLWSHFISNYALTCSFYDSVTISHAISLSVRKELVMWCFKDSSWSIYIPSCSGELRTAIWVYVNIFGICKIFVLVFRTASASHEDSVQGQMKKFTPIFIFSYITSWKRNLMREASLNSFVIVYIMYIARSRALVFTTKFLYMFSFLQQNFCTLTFL